MKKHTTDQIIRKLREAEVLVSQGKGVAAPGCTPSCAHVVVRQERPNRTPDA